MQRVPDGKGGQIWKISNATVAHIPEMWEELGYHPIAKYLADTLPTFRLLGMENWQVFLLGLSLLLAWPLATLICVLLTRAIVTRSGPFMDAINNFLKLQFRIFLYFIIVRAVFEIIGLSLYSKALLQSAGFTYIAVIILLFGITNLLLGYQARRLLQAGNEHYVALLKPASTVIKVLLCIAMVLVWAENAGYSMSTLLAGLGVGSLAVALAAQKTLENIIGAITIYSARPIKPGDFCRFGTTVGTVEEIGLRSTMLRTLNRTLVSIPNSIFAGEEVENYSERDRIRYFRYLRLEIGSPDQLRSLLSELRKLFSSRKMLQADTISIRFDEITDNTAHVRVDAGVMTNDFQTYLEEAEELNLHILELVHNAGINFSGPGQQLTLRSGGTQTAPDPDALERFLASQQTSPAGSGD
jgi:MscS family membrane protein